MENNKRRQNLIVPKKSTNQRLDIFLSKKLCISRSQAQKLINNKQITINDKQPQKTGYRIKESDQIQFDIKISEKLSHNNVTCLIDRLAMKQCNLPHRQAGNETIGAKNIENYKMEIISENPDYLVVNKPTGMLTHPAPNSSNDNEALSQILIKKYPEIKKVGDDIKLRPGIVHRLDKDASGLLVVARTQKMFNHLKLQFKNREIKKEYLTLVHGKVNQDCGEINFPIARTKNSDKMASVPLTKYGRPRDDGKEAMTEFDVEKRFSNSTLLRVKIHTGRTHQIRVHLLAYNHPIVGDPLYFQKKQKRKLDEKCGRLFLHCVQLGFVDLDKKLQNYNIDLPQNLANFLKLLK